MWDNILSTENIVPVTDTHAFGLSIGNVFQSPSGCCFIIPLSQFFPLLQNILFSGQYGLSLDIPMFKKVSRFPILDKLGETDYINRPKGTFKIKEFLLSIKAEHFVEIPFCEVSSVFLR